MWYFVV